MTAMSEHAILMCRRSAQGLAHVPPRKFQTRRPLTWRNTLIDGQRSRTLFGQLDLDSIWRDAGGVCSVHGEQDVYYLTPIWSRGDCTLVNWSKPRPGSSVGAEVAGRRWPRLAAGTRQSSRKPSMSCLTC